MVPTEIMDHILSFLHSDKDYTTLESCSVVFPQIVDRHLYSHIGFTSYYNPAAVALMPSRASFNEGVYIVHPTKFSHMLINRPHVANYVRVVRLCMGSYSTPANRPALFADLSSILPILRHIESISLRANGILQWHTLGAKFCTDFRDIIRLPSIKEVAITNVYGLSLDAFYNCENLKNLVLYGQFLGGEGTPTSSYPQLCSLSVDRHTNPTRMASWINCMKANTVDTLCLRISPKDGDLFKFLPLIEACSNTLVNLELDLLLLYRELRIFHSKFPLNLPTMKLQPHYT